MVKLTLENRSWMLRLAFFIVVPVLLALPLGLFQAGFAQYLPLHLAIIYWIIPWLANWWLSELCLRVWYKVLRPWNVPLVPEIVLAVLSATILSSIYFPFFMEFASRFAHNLPQGFFDYRVQQPVLDRWLALLRSGIPGLIAWTALRTVYAMIPTAPWTLAAAAQSRSSALHPSRPANQNADHAHAAITPFGRELAAHGIRDLSSIAALRASDHYVTVYLNDGEEVLILSRFSDAISAMEMIDGLRIHRSFWVRRQAITNVEHDGAALVALLVTGLRCPVSTKYQGLLEHMIQQS